MAYSETFITETIVRLAVNRFDYDKTAEQMGVTARTIRNWEKNFPKKGVPELLERAIERLLMVIPSDMKGNDWAVALGILMDKWLLVNGQATQRTENLIGSINDLPEEEKSAIIREAENIIASAVSKRSGGGNDTQNHPEEK
jgi:hypothetical protein